VFHFAFGLFWVFVAMAIFLARPAFEAKGRDVGTLVVFAAMLAVYNFVRCGVTWMIRRRRTLNDHGTGIPMCPRCGRPMKLVDLGPDCPTEKDRWSFVCCGLQLHIEDDDVRRTIVTKIRGN
jgi:hypothetical protein